MDSSTCWPRIMWRTATTFDFNALSKRKQIEGLETQDEEGIFLRRPE